MRRPGSRLRATFTGLAATTALALAGCGGDDGGGASGDLAGYAPAGTPVYIEGTVRPEGELRDNIEQLVSSVAGLEDPGRLIIDEIDSEFSDEDSELTYEKDIEPWLGEDAALFIGDLSGDDENFGIVVSTTDSDAAQGFIDKLAKQAGDSLESASYEGADYKLSPDGESFGIVDGAVVFAGGEKTFEGIVDASGGDSLEDDGDFADLLDEAPEESLADVYIDTEGLLAELRKRLDEDERQFLESLGQQGDPGSGLVSLVPGADRVELQALSTAKGFTEAGSPQLLEALPAKAFAALAAPDVGEQLTRVINQIDENGIPGEVPPNQLKGALERFGIDLEGIAASIGDVGLYAEGTNRRNVGGAVVVETDDAQRIASTLNNLEKILRQRRVEGYQPLPGGAAGFSIRDPEELGPQPLVFLASGDRFVIGYGEESARQAVGGGGGQTLAANPAYQEAADALGGGVEPTGFVDLQALVALIEGVRPDLTGEADYQMAKPYLSKLAYVVFGSGTQGDLTAARFVLGLAE